MITDTADDVLAPVGIPYNTRERFPDLVQIGRAHFQEAHARSGVVAGRGNRMENLVSEGGGQLAHYAQAVEMREVCFQLPQSLMLLLRSLRVP